MEEGHLIKAAGELAKELDKAVDEYLPQKLAGIVKLHAKLAVGSAFIPIPGADIAAAGANTWAMYVRINKELNLPFSENVVKSLAAGVMTNVAAGAAALVVGASAIKLLPGLGTVGGIAVMATTIYALTIAAGIVYMKALTRLLRAKSADQITEADLKDAAHDVLKDKAAIREIVKDAKKSYKKSDEAHQEAPEPGSAPRFATGPETPEQPSAASAVAVIFLSTGGETYGPYPMAEVQRLRRSGQLAQDTHYWVEGMDEWIPIEYLPVQPSGPNSRGFEGSSRYPHRADLRLTGG